MAPIIRVAIIGAAGRMGERLMARIAARQDFELVSTLDVSGASWSPPATVVATADPAAALVVPDPPVQVALDFSAPPACGDLLPTCAEHGVAYLVASTSLEEAHQEAVTTAASRIPVLVASNCSIGINLLHQLARLAAEKLGAAFDVEISEIHHRHKRDAPSGTALSLGRAVQEGRGALEARLGRAGREEPRSTGQLGYAALRGGDVSGEHTVFFLGDGERVELTHRATTRDIFADGALRAAKWLVGRSPGLYSMRDVLTGDR